MPTYIYKCNKCGHVFEVFQSIIAEPIQECQKLECKGPVERVISAGAGFIFKGSGFYITDYRSESYKKRAEAESKSSSKDTTTSSDSKPDKSSSSESKTAPPKSES